MGNHNIEGIINTYSNSLQKKCAEDYYKIPLVTDTESYQAMNNWIKKKDMELWVQSEKEGTGYNPKEVLTMLPSRWNYSNDKYNALMEKYNKIEEDIGSFIDLLYQFLNENRETDRDNNSKEFNDFVRKTYFESEMGTEEDPMINSRLENEKMRLLVDLENIISYVTIKGYEKVVCRDIFSEESEEIWCHPLKIELYKDVYEKCPSCNKWVHKSVYRCTCGHQFMESPSERRSRRVKEQRAERRKRSKSKGQSKGKSNPPAFLNPPASPTSTTP